MRLLARHFIGTILSLLTDHRARQQLLLFTQGHQPLQVLPMQKQAVLVWTDPAAAFHLETTAGLQCFMGELAIEIVSVGGPAFRQPVNNKILKPHGGIKSRGL